MGPLKAPCHRLETHPFPAEVDLRMVGTKYAAGKISDIEVKCGPKGATWKGMEIDWKGGIDL